MTEEQGEVGHDWVWTNDGGSERCVNCGGQRKASVTPRRYVYWDARGVFQKGTINNCAVADAGKGES